MGDSREGDVLASAEELMSALGILSFGDHDFARSLDEAVAAGSFLGRGTGTEFLSEVTRWRRFFVPSAMYGHRLATGVSILSRYPYAEHDDLLVVDRSHVSKNAVLGEDSEERIRAAKLRRARVIAFFGGSTIQGYGARLPQYSIPAQVESILRLRHGVDAVCLNYGVAGWTCVESLNLLIHEVSDSLDVAVFYDGWNCCNEAFLSALVADGFGSAGTSPCIFPGTSMRHVEQDFVRGLHYSASHLWRRSFRLSVNRLLTWIAGGCGASRLSRLLNRLLQRFFSIAEIRLLRERLDRVVLAPGAEREVIRRVADAYVRTHDKIARWCEACGIQRIHAFQPLLPNSGKVRTPREETFYQSGLPWGRPYVSALFRDAIRDYPGMTDLSDALDDVRAEVFVDAGHLNMQGNFHVAVRLAEQLARQTSSTGGGE